MITTNTKGPDARNIEAPEINTNASEFSKAEANIKALFALQGHAVHDSDAGGYIIVRSDWGMSRHCAGYPDLVAAARQMGVCK